MENAGDPVTKSWGYKMLSGTYTFSRKGTFPPHYPEWVGRHVTSYARHSGVVIWDNIAKKADIFSPAECLILLDRLKNTTDWKETGVSLTKRVYRIALPIDRKKKKHGKSAEVEAEQKEEKQSAEPIDEEVVHLPPEAGEELISLFETNKTLLIKDAEADEKMRKEAIFRVYGECQDHCVRGTKVKETGAAQSE